MLDKHHKNTTKYLEFVKILIYPLPLLVLKLFQLTVCVYILLHVGAFMCVLVASSAL